VWIEDYFICIWSSFRKIQAKKKRGIKIELIMQIGGSEIVKNMVLLSRYINSRVYIYEWIAIKKMNFFISSMSAYFTVCCIQVSFTRLNLNKYLKIIILSIILYFSSMHNLRIYRSKV